LDDDEQSQNVQGQSDVLNGDDNDEHGENAKLITPSETSSLTSLHTSLGEDDKENHTRGYISQGATGGDEISTTSEDLIEVKDKAAGVKRKRSESDASSVVCPRHFTVSFSRRQFNEFRNKLRISSSFKLKS
jgi:hypothetical protein